MIYFVTPGSAMASVVARVAAEQGGSSGLYRSVAAESPPIEIRLAAEGGGEVQYRPSLRDVPEEFDWSIPKTRKTYLRLEQKVLAKRATTKEASQYRSMKKDRNSHIFADRSLRDYAE